MRLSSMADYAVVTMSAAARHCGAVAAGSRISAADLAAETGLPLPTVQKLVTILSKAGLIKGLRGAGGGNQLARPAAAITLADIVEAVEGPIALASCLDESSGCCQIEQACSVKPHWPVVNQALRGALAQVSLIQLSAGAVQ